jgi:hypothetical protein
MVKRFEKRTLESHGFAGRDESVFSLSVNAAGSESKDERGSGEEEWLTGAGWTAGERDWERDW